MSWFAERADRIILLFDAHKLDISDELRRAIQALSRWDEKIRIILNKVMERISWVFSSAPIGAP